METKATLPAGAQDRKNIPMATGVLDYFPAALAYIAKISKAGNDKHNPGEPLHWARGKSMDHADCVARHLADRGTVDTEDNLRHSGKLAWRALALLQEELEREEGAPLPRGASALAVKPPIQWIGAADVGDLLEEQLGAPIGAPLRVSKKPKPSEEARVGVRWRCSGCLSNRRWQDSAWKSDADALAHYNRGYAVSCDTHGCGGHMAPE